VKKNKGLGTISLLLGLIASLVWTSYIDGTSVIQIAGKAIGFTNSTVLALCALAVTVPGIILGIVRHKDWGAKFGAFLCFSATCYTLAPFVKTLFM
jgi:uncharacterized membrane protein YhaH (DUF805 family)